MIRPIFSLLILMLSASFAHAGSSYYPLRPVDAQAVYVLPEQFGVSGDGVADDTAGIQKAIDHLQEKNRQGVVFLPAGRYRITHTIHIWPGVRVIGYGSTRPVLVLGVNTPGFQGDGTNMVMFTGNRPPAVQTDHGMETPEAKISDGTPGTFYSALSNVDFEIQDGNPGAIGVRGRYAQHCYLAHIDFHIGSGLAGIHDSGNVAEDVHFYGGKYGIWTRKPSPGWQFTVIDATFEGQRSAAILEHEAGLTLIRPQFKDVPTAVEIEPKFSDELWLKDARMENVSGPAIVISNEANAHTEINAENLICVKVPMFVQYRESGRQVAGPAGSYAVKAFSHGLHFDDIGTAPTIRDVFETAALATVPAPVRSDIAALPPMDSWVNVRELGARGDGVADDTEALRKAIAGHKALYFPAGLYLVTDTLTLRSDTILIGLHPSITRIFIADKTPAFQGIGDAVPLIETPKGGTNIVTGIGLYTNGVNPRATAALWMAGKDSMAQDVRFLGGHGTTEFPPVRGGGIYNNTHTADTNLERRWDAQYPSLWVTNGGGGTFENIWTPSTFAQAGLYVSDTATSGRVYELSSEHHVRNEVMFRRASNWEVYALQTEEERGEGGFCLPLQVEDSSNITFANFHLYRVVSMFQPFPYAMKVTNSKNIRFRNVHNYSDSKASFDSSIYDQTHDVQLRDREFAWLNISGNAPAAVKATASPVRTAAAKVTKLSGGFFNISGGAADANGNLFFVDARKQMIYRWNVAAGQLETVRDNPLDPVQLAFDKSGDLLVMSYAGTVYSFRPDAKDASVTMLKPTPIVSMPGATAVLPLNYWRPETNFLETLKTRNTYQFISPDKSTFIPVGDDFVTGKLYYGIRMHDSIRAFGLLSAPAGKPFYFSDESQEKTYVASVLPDGNLTDAKLFAEQGGEGVAVDPHGNVYLAAGPVYVYDPSGRLIDTIYTPQRPIQIVFGGKDGRTLFILSRDSLYSIATR
jgi:sugar lactone lactonase YvrE